MRSFFARLGASRPKSSNLMLESLESRGYFCAVPVCATAPTCVGNDPVAYCGPQSCQSFDPDGKGSCQTSDPKQECSAPWQNPCQSQSCDPAPTCSDPCQKPADPPRGHSCDPKPDYFCHKFSQSKLTEE